MSTYNNVRSFQTPTERQLNEQIRNPEMLAMVFVYK